MFFILSEKISLKGIIHNLSFTIHKWVDIYLCCSWKETNHLKNSKMLCKKTDMDTQKVPEILLESSNLLVYLLM